jgi:outer membrane lipopolysaccharide assembly protein LptE/RlpB
LRRKYSFPDGGRAGRALALLALMAAALSGCGYRIAGRANTLPPTVKTIAVPAFENRTSTYRIEQRLTSAVVHELLVGTRYRVVSRAADGDAVLYGVVTGIGSGAVVFDQSTGRATTVLVTVTMQARLEDRRTGNVLYRNDRFIFREPYEISTDIPSFFEESGPAMDRVSRDFAKRLVAEMRESF